MLLFMQPSSYPGRDFLDAEHKAGYNILKKGTDSNPQKNNAGFFWKM
jgi:hypothetical protein